MTDVGSCSYAPNEQTSRLSSVLLAQVEAHGADLADAVQSRVEFYRDVGVVALDRLQQSCTANLRFMFEALARTGPADPAAARATGVERADNGVPLPAVMSAYRVGLRITWEHVIAEARRAGFDTDTLLAVTGRAMEAHDLFTHEMSAAYNERLTARIVRQEAERSALVEAVLTATVTDRKTLWEAADALGLPTTGFYAVVAAELPAAGRTALPDIAGVLGARGISSAWRLQPELQVGVVAMPRSRMLDPLIERLVERATGRVGVSPLFATLADAAENFELARLAVRSRSSSDPGVAQFTDNPVGIAAVSQPAVMQRAVETILTPLQVPADDGQDSLLGTLEAWVDSGGSTTKTAGRLAVHPNTIRNRLRHIEELTGRRLHRPTDVAAICLALQVLAYQRRRTELS